MASYICNTSDATRIRRTIADQKFSDTSDPWTAPSVEVVEAGQADDEKEPEQEEESPTFDVPPPGSAPVRLLNNARERPRQVASGYG